jgi:hypothetical protein
LDAEFTVRQVEGHFSVANQPSGYLSSLHLVQPPPKLNRQLHQTTVAGATVGATLGGGLRIINVFIGGLGVTGPTVDPEVAGSSPVDLAEQKPLVSK